MIAYEDVKLQTMWKIQGLMVVRTLLLRGKMTFRAVRSCGQTHGQLRWSMEQHPKPNDTTTHAKQQNLALLLILSHRTAQCCSLALSDCCSLLSGVRASSVLIWFVRTFTDTSVQVLATINNPNPSCFYDRDTISWPNNQRFSQFQFDHFWGNSI